MDRDDLRIGDAEREQTMASLREHFAQGRLTHEELDERLDRTLAAKTARDLAQITADLPGSRFKEPSAPPAEGFDHNDWREAMGSYRNQMQQARHQMHQQRRQMRREWRHQGGPGPWGRRGPGPFVPLLFAAVIVGLVVGGFGIFFKVLLAFFVVAVILRLVFGHSHRPRR
ncbi:DUF1707 SHOCT-like domain-containing protein [Nonomuraea sediminis]|uniref:DUF1707 SHOCT-like domain-containing protein n=1 Tax=Nonomuraea sediminis TaxID=2835864 RepID=UPI001BDD6309|nr:DUF1707 domain-containing protein [Nonomuraea sediminis]